MSSDRWADEVCEGVKHLAKEAESLDRVNGLPVILIPGASHLGNGSGGVGGEAAGAGSAVAGSSQERPLC